ncbi:MAG TPA: YolD-like family protein [Haploplasma sp.]|nr:YolD-like family protein [Haploplasma sp.]
MSDIYVDRGLIKWAPFDALTGIDNLLNEIRYRNNKIAKPTLSQDLIESINYELQEAYELNKEIQVNYFSDGYIKDTYGFIKRFDQYDALLYLNNGMKLKLDDIINLYII